MAAIDTMWLGATIHGTVLVDCYTCGETVAEGDALGLDQAVLAAAQHVCPKRSEVKTRGEGG